MILIIFLNIVALIIGISLLFGVKTNDISVLVLSPFEKSIERKRKIDFIKGTKPKGLSAYYTKLTEMLANMGKNKNFSKYIFFSAFLGLCGLMTGIMTQNIFLGITLLVALASIPFLVLNIQYAKYQGHLLNVLVGTLTVISNSYTQTADLKKSIRDNLENMDRFMVNIFKEFLTESEYIDSNIENCLNSLAGKIDNTFFREWCGTLVQCQYDKQLRYSLSGTIDRVNVANRIQMEFDTIVKNMIRVYITAMLLTILCVPLMATGIPDWGTSLVDTSAGKISMAVTSILILCSFIVITKISKPVQVI